MPIVTLSVSPRYSKSIFLKKKHYLITGLPLNRVNPNVTVAIVR